MLDLCAVRKIQNGLRELEEELQQRWNISLVEAMCLCGIEQGYKEIAQLTKELSLSPSRLTRIIDSLELKQLLIREQSPESRRSIYLALTPKGRSVMKEYHCAPIAVPDALLGAMQ